MVTKNISQQEEMILRFSTAQSEKYGVIRVENSDYNHIVVIETDAVDHYSVELRDIGNESVPIAWFQPGRYQTFSQSGLFHVREAEPQLLSLAAVVDLHLGTRHYLG